MHFLGLLGGMAKNSGNRRSNRPRASGPQSAGEVPTPPVEAVGTGSAKKSVPIIEHSASDASSLGELVSYYRIRDVVIGHASAGRTILVSVAVVVGTFFMIVPIRLTPDVARVIGLASLVVALLLLLSTLARSRRMIRETRTMRDLIEQIMQCDALVRRHRQSTYEIREAEQFFNSKFSLIHPTLQRLAQEDHLTPIRFPLNQESAATARIALDEAHNMTVLARTLIAVIGTVLFLVVWTSAFILTWSMSPAPCVLGAAECAGSFQGLPARPMLGDFIYLALNAAVANMPADIIARSQVAHTIFAATFISGVLIVGLYLVPAVSNLQQELRAMRVAGRA